MFLRLHFNSQKSLKDITTSSQQIVRKHNLTIQVIFLKNNPNV